MGSQDSYRDSDSASQGSGDESMTTLPKGFLELDIGVEKFNKLDSRLDRRVHDLPGVEPSELYGFGSDLRYPVGHLVTELSARYEKLKTIRAAVEARTKEFDSLQPDSSSGGSQGSNDEQNYQKVLKWLRPRPGMVDRLRDDGVAVESSTQVAARTKVEKLEAANLEQSEKIAALQKLLDSQREANTRSETAITAMRQETEILQERYRQRGEILEEAHTDLQQKQNSMTETNDELQAANGTIHQLRCTLGTARHGKRHVERELRDAKERITELETDLEEAQTTRSSVAKARERIGGLETDRKELKELNDSLTGELSKERRELSELQNSRDELRKIHAELEANHSRSQADVARLRLNRDSYRQKYLDEQASTRQQEALAAESSKKAADLHRQNLEVRDKLLEVEDDAAELHDYARPRINKLTSELDEKDESLNTVRGEFAELQRQSTEILGARDQQISDLQKSLKSIGSQLHTHAQRIGMVKRKRDGIDDTERPVKNVKEEDIEKTIQHHFKDLSLTTDSLSKDAGEVSRDLANAYISIGDLQKRLEKANADLNTLRESDQSKGVTLEELEQNWAVSEQARISAEKQVSQLNGEVQSLNLELEKVKRSLLERSQEVNTGNQMYRGVLAQIDEVNGNLTTANQSLQSKTSEYDQVMSDLELRVSELDETTRKLTETGELLDSRGQELGKVKETVGTQAATIQKLELELREYTEKLSKAETVVGTRDKELEMVNQSMKEKSDLAGRLDRDLTKRIQERDEAVEELSKAQTVVQTRDKELELVNQSVNEKSDLAGRLEQDLTARTRERDEATEKLSKAQTIVEARDKELGLVNQLVKEKSDLAGRLEQDLTERTRERDEIIEKLSKADDDIKAKVEELSSLRQDSSEQSEALKTSAIAKKNADDLIKARGESIANLKKEKITLEKSVKERTLEVERLQVYETAMIWSGRDLPEAFCKSIEEVMSSIVLKDRVETSKFGFGGTGNQGVFHHLMRLRVDDVSHDLLADVNALIEALKTDEARLAAAGLVVFLRNLNPSRLATLVTLRSIRELCCVGVELRVLPQASGVLTEALKTDVEALLEHKEFDMAQYIRDNTIPCSTRAVCEDVEFVRDEEDLVMLQGTTVTVVLAGSWKVEQKFDDETFTTAFRLVITDALCTWNSPWWDEDWYFVNVQNITDIGVA